MKKGENKEKFFELKNIELKKYINKLKNRLRDKQTYISYLLMVIQRENIKFDKNEYKRYKKNKRDFLKEEQEDLMKFTNFSDTHNEERTQRKNKTPELIPNFQAEEVTKKLNFIPMVRPDEGNLVHYEIEPSMPIIKSIPGIIREPLSNNGSVGEVFSILALRDEIEKYEKEQVNIINKNKSTHPSPAAINKDPYEDLINEIKERINKNEYEYINKNLKMQLAGVSTEMLKNLSNYLKRKIKKNKGVLNNDIKIELFSFKNTLDYFLENDDSEDN